MRHVSLTCKNHPHLRWSTKHIAWTPRPDGSGVYNGCRNIFYCGTATGNLNSDASGVECTLIEPECSCPTSDLILSPDDARITRREGDDE